MSGKKMQRDRREITSRRQECLNWKQDVKPLNHVEGVLKQKRN